MQSRLIWRGFRCAASAGVSIVLVLAATYVPHVNHTTVALLLVLVILGISVRWGWIEALTTSIAGGIVFDFFFLPRRGFSLETAEHWVTLGSFLLTAVVTGQLSARAARHRREAESRRDETERLYRLSNALLYPEIAEGDLVQMVDRVIEVFRVRGAAYYDLQQGRIFRAGDPFADEDLLKLVASTGNPLADAAGGGWVVPVRQGAALVGSLAIHEGSLPKRLAEAIAERAGLALAKASTAKELLAVELARRSENLKSAILDALAHEIRGPLATIKVSVSTLLSQQPGDELQQRELMAIIDEESDRMEKWIDDAIQVSRSDALGLRLKKEPHSLREVAARALDSLGPLTKGRPIEVHVPDSLPMAVFDAELMEKVIRLLLDNALKYSPPGSPVTLSAAFTGAEIVLTVEDHGPGVPAREREQIFEPYYRGSNVRHGASGTGLGLASARCIMQAHGGEIWVTASEGVGSVFHISLPATMNMSDGQSQGPECR